MAAGEFLTSVSDGRHHVSVVLGRDAWRTLSLSATWRHVGDRQEAAVAVTPARLRAHVVCPLRPVLTAAPDDDVGFDAVRTCLVELLAAMKRDHALDALTGCGS